jgi:hypothetical protein
MNVGPHTSEYIVASSGAPDSKLAGSAILVRDPTAAGSDLRGLTWPVSCGSEEDTLCNSLGPVL